VCRILSRSVQLFRPRPGAEDRGEEPGSLKLGLGAAVPLSIFPHAPDTRARLLDIADAMQQVGHKQIATDAHGAKVSRRQPLWQATRVRDLDSVWIDLHEDVRPSLEVIPVHDRVRNGFS
jgi:hypothetical protein